VTASGHCEGVALLVKKGVAVIERSVLALSLDARDALEGRTSGWCCAPPSGAATP